MIAEDAPTVFIVDDDAHIRMAIQSMLKAGGLRSESFSSPQEFMRRKLPESPSCLVLDVKLSGASGLDFQRHLREANIEIPIVFITVHGDIPMSVSAMKLGAVEFLTKPFKRKALLGAIEQALDRDRTQRQKRTEIAELRRRYDPLTAREREVMELVTCGFLNKQIVTR